MSSISSKNTVMVSTLIFLGCTSQDEFRNVGVSYFFFVENLPAISHKSCKKIPLLQIMYLHGDVAHICIQNGELAAGL